MKKESKIRYVVSVHSNFVISFVLRDFKIYFANVMNVKINFICSIAWLYERSMWEF